MDLYDKIKKLARQNKISIAQLERSLDISNGSISKWNVSHPNSDPLKKVADYFKVSTDYLLDRANNPKVNNGEYENESDLLIAAHIREGLSEEEKEEVMKYIEFLKSKHADK